LLSEPAPAPSPISSSKRVPQAVADPGPSFDLAKKLSEQGKTVGGRTFYKRNDQWVDQQISTMTDAPITRVEFDSDAYYTLILKHPVTQPWLALGRNVKFVLNGRIIEVFDNSK